MGMHRAVLVQTCCWCLYLNWKRGRKNPQIVVLGARHMAADERGIRDSLSPQTQMQRECCPVQYGNMDLRKPTLKDISGIGAELLYRQQWSANWDSAFLAEWSAKGMCTTCCCRTSWDLDKLWGRWRPRLSRRTWAGGRRPGQNCFSMASLWQSILAWSWDAQG